MADRPPIDPIRGDFGFDSILLNFDRISLKLISFEFIEPEGVLDSLDLLLDFRDFDFVGDLDFVDDLTDKTDPELDGSRDFVDDLRESDLGVGQFEWVYLDIELCVISRPLS